jgi:hypothetical protein
MVFMQATANRYLILDKLYYLDILYEGGLRCFPFRPWAASFRCKTLSGEVAGVHGCSDVRASETMATKMITALLIIAIIHNVSISTEILARAIPEAFSIICTAVL